MKIVEPGHVYQLDWLDGTPEDDTLWLRGFLAEPRPDHLVFVCRESEGQLTSHPGTQTQEVLRALIDRTMHCDNCLRWEGNDLIIHHLRMALVLHEARALGRKVEKGLLAPESVRTHGDGHFFLDSRGGLVGEDAQEYMLKPKG